MSWEVTLCTWLSRTRRFGGTQCFQIGSSGISRRSCLSLQKKAVKSFETSGTTHILVTLAIWMWEPNISQWSISLLKYGLVTWRCPLWKCLQWNKFPKPWWMQIIKDSPTFTVNQRFRFVIMSWVHQLQSLVTTTCLIWPSVQTTVVFSKGFYATYKMYQTCFSAASPFSLRWGLTQFYCLVQTWPNSK